MAKEFQVDVVSPEATIWSGKATLVIARTSDGELGIMAGHEPLMGALTTGAVQVDDEDGVRSAIGVHGGFLQVLNNRVTLITDRAQISRSHEEASEVAVRLAELEEEGRRAE